MVTDDMENPVKTGYWNWSTEHMCAVLVIAALAFLILIRRGFRSLSLGGASVSLR